ncbi:hypothetical protein AXI76_gp228 [Pseudoalteromonas phage H101]|uniref:Inh N-terminal domain-containing protein n=1 Tax=Pseudoalteromonas phage H101 TaxID=1654919 RepID=A0A0H4INF8_9CAUD|nr:hypothetical protein AXI76_gp228 [Pseudoalteromonas phage H101]AKO61129.1 hypothetical protein [Pseudoalteromonas phage H101]
MLVNCLSKLDMLKKLDSKVEGLDVSVSAFKPLFIFSDTQGKEYNCQTAQSFVTEFNKRFGEVLGGSTRTIGKRKFVIELLDKETIMEVEEYKKDVKVELENTTVEGETSIDIEYAKSLEEGATKKEAKDALADYAQKFDIVLQKNKSFDNMIADLEEETAA